LFSYLLTQLCHPLRASLLHHLYGTGQREREPLIVGSPVLDLSVMAAIPPPMAYLTLVTIAAAGTADVPLLGDEGLGSVLAADPSVADIIPEIRAR
jgi:hypothetical protein